MLWNLNMDDLQQCNVSPCCQSVCATVYNIISRCQSVCATVYISRCQSVCVTVYISRCQSVRAKWTNDNCVIITHKRHTSAQMTPMLYPISVTPGWMIYVCFVSYNKHVSFPTSAYRIHLSAWNNLAQSQSVVMFLQFLCNSRIRTFAQCPPRPTWHTLKDNHINPIK